MDLNGNLVLGYSGYLKMAWLEVAISSIPRKWRERDQEVQLQCMLVTAVHN